MAERALNLHNSAEAESKIVIESEAFALIKQSLDDKCSDREDFISTAHYIASLAVQKLLSPFLAALFPPPSCGLNGPAQEVIPTCRLFVANVYKNVKIQPRCSRSRPSTFQHSRVCGEFRNLYLGANLKSPSLAAVLPGLSRGIRTKLVESPGRDSEAEGSVALPSGADPRTGQRAPTQEPALPLRQNKFLPRSSPCPGLPVPGLSWFLVAGSPALPRRVPVWFLSSSCFFPLAASVTFQLPAGGTSGQAHGHRPKNRPSQSISLFALCFNLDFAYGVASVLTDRGRVCRGDVRFR